MSLYRQLKFRRALSRFIIWGGVLTCMMVGLRLVWGWEAGARLSAVRTLLASEGLPLTTRTFAQQPVPDDQNAASVLVTAIRSLRLEMMDPGRGEPHMHGMGGMGGGFGPGWGRSSMMDAARWRPVVVANHDVLVAIDRAVALPRASWPNTTDSLWNRSSNSPSFLGNFGLRMLLRAAAQVAREDGHDLDAIAALHRMLAVAHLLDSSNDLFSHVAAAGIRSEAAQLYERWDLRPTPDTLTPMHDLVQAFAQASESSTNIARSFEYETAAYAEFAADNSPAVQSWWLRPLAIDSVARGLALQEKLLPLVRATNWQQVAAIPLPPAPANTNLNKIVLSLSEPRLEVVEVLRTYFRSLADTRAISLLAAANLYRAEHARFPTSMDALVPAYLSAIPVDPFDAAGKPFHYRLDGGDDDQTPTVWSVGENGIDDGGAIAPLSGGGGFGGSGGSAWGGGGGFGGGGFGSGGYGFGRRYGQLDLVYGNAWRLMAASRPASR